MQNDRSKFQEEFRPRAYRFAEVIGVADVLALSIVTLKGKR
jgi:hypothetical protein